MGHLTSPKEADQFAADAADIESVSVADLSREARTEVLSLRAAFHREASMLAEALEYPSFPVHRRAHADAQLTRLRGCAGGRVFDVYDDVDPELLEESLRLIPAPVTVREVAEHTAWIERTVGGDLRLFGEVFAELRALRERAAFESTVLASHVRKPARFPKARVMLILEGRDRLVQAARGRARFEYEQAAPLF